MNRLPLLLLTFLLCHCTPPSKPADLEAEKEAFTATAESYYQLMNDNDWPGLKSVYSSNAKLIPNNNDIISGEEGVSDFIDGFKTRRNFQVRYEDLNVSLSEGGDMGYSIAKVFVSFQDTSGNQINGTNRDLHIWEKEDGEWKIVVDIWNAPASGVGTTEKEDGE